MNGERNYKKKCFKTSEFEIPFIVTVAIACVTNNQFSWRFFSVCEKQL